jgi:hypothetical protein
MHQAKNKNTNNKKGAETDKNFFKCNTIEKNRQNTKPPNANGVLVNAISLK